MGVGDPLWSSDKRYNHVDELRKMRRKWPDSVAFLRGTASDKYWSPCWRERLTEAAEEIERLQAEVAELKTHGA